MQKSFLKGVTPALAVILLASVTVGVVSTAYYGISSTTKEAANVSGKQIEQQFEIAGSELKLDNLGNCKIYLRNTGTKDVPIEVISFYVAEPGTETYEPVTTHPTTGTIKKDATQEINFLNLNPKRYKLIVKIYGNRMDYGYLTCTGPSNCGNEDLDAGEECDDTNLNGQTCVSLGFTGGTLSCTDSCTFNTSGCTAPIAFSCSIKTGSCGSETEVLALSAKNNSHTEIVGASGGYSQKLCCSNISSVQTTTGTGDCNTLGAGFTGLVTLSGDTNAQVEKYNYTGTDGFSYKKNVCVKLTSGSLECSYVPSSACSDIKVVSISSDTNAHIGNSTAYSDLVLCCEK